MFPPGGNLFPKKILSDFEIEEEKRAPHLATKTQYKKNGNITPRHATRNKKGRRLRPPCAPLDTQKNIKPIKRRISKTEWPFKKNLKTYGSTTGQNEKATAPIQEKKIKTQDETKPNKQTAAFFQESKRQFGRGATPSSAAV